MTSSDLLVRRGSRTGPPPGMPALLTRTSHGPNASCTTVGSGRELLAVGHVARHRERRAPRALDPIGEHRPRRSLRRAASTTLRAALREPDRRAPRRSPTTRRSRPRPRPSVACPLLYAWDAWTLSKPTPGVCRALDDRWTPRPYPREELAARSGGRPRRRGGDPSARQRPREHPAAAGGRSRQAVRALGAARTGSVLQDILDMVSAGAGVADRSDAAVRRRPHRPGADPRRVRGARPSGSRSPPKAASAC